MDEGTFQTVINFPRPWPPQVDGDLFSHKDKDSEVKLSSDTDGRFILAIHSSGHEERVYRFQPIRIEGGGTAMLTVIWSKKIASLYLNVQKVKLDEDVQGEPMVLKTKDHPPPPPQGLVLGNVDLNAAKSDPEYLFLSTVADIDRKVKEGSRYNLIRAAGVLRQLFLDAIPLVYVVNRVYRLKIEFEMLDYRWEPVLSPVARSICLDSSFFPGAKTFKSNLKGFLNAPCFRIEDKTATVRDLIHVCAHVKGGVHLGKAKTFKENVVVDWDRMFLLSGMDPSLAAIAGVCRVALKGLKPLVQAIMSST